LPGFASRVRRNFSLDRMSHIRQIRDTEAKLNELAGAAWCAVHTVHKFHNVMILWPARSFKIGLHSERALMSTDPVAKNYLRLV